MHRKRDGRTKITRPSLRALNPKIVARARKEFRRREPRDLFYRAATELIELSLHQKTSLTVAEALALLLQTWNKAHYQFNPFTAATLNELEQLIAANQSVLSALRLRSIDTWTPGDVRALQRIFTSFEMALGPVGAAKALHLLAPKFLPIWDREIAKAYGLPLGIRGSNSIRYVTFIEIVKIQCELMPTTCGSDPLKAIDEYNYCKFTKGWI